MVLLDAVYTGDWRALATMFGNADLFGAFSANLREGDPNRFIDRAKTKKVADYPGKTATPFTRPQSWGLDVRETPNTDTVVVRSPAMSTWHPDCSTPTDSQRTTRTSPTRTSCRTS
jgi:hypothetical protein